MEMQKNMRMHRKRVRKMYGDGKFRVGARTGQREREVGFQAKTLTARYSFYGVMPEIRPRHRPTGELIRTAGISIADSTTFSNIRNVFRISDP